MDRIFITLLLRRKIIRRIILIKEKEDIVVEVISDVDTIEEKTYSIVLHNDDVTPVPFVFVVLIEVFEKSMEETMRIVVQTELNGKAAVKQGLSFEEANKKYDEAMNYCKEEGMMDLKFTIEEE
jgi:ATP-dependent Clp protease adaptor protein ClpS